MATRLRPAAPDTVPVPVPMSVPVPAGEALAAFEALAARWGLPPARAWRMLTGQPSRPGGLDGEGARRVVLLVAIDAVLATFVTDIGAWAVAPNPGPLLMGTAPVDYLAAGGTPGYLALLRQARRWAAL